MRSISMATMCLRPYAGSWMTWTERLTKMSNQHDVEGFAKHSYITITVYSFV